MEEIWMEIPGYEGLYKVSNFGKIYSIRTNIVIKTKIEKNGYERFAIWINGKGKMFTVHHVVCLAFIGQRKPGEDIDHIDNNRSNNKLENLRYVTRSFNVKKSFDGKRKGVSICKKNKKTPRRWRADIWINGKKIFIGSFVTKEQALDAYNKKHFDTFGY